MSFSGDDEKGREPEDRDHENEKGDVRHSLANLTSRDVAGVELAHAFGEASDDTTAQKERDAASDRRESQMPKGSDLRWDQPLFFKEIATPLATPRSDRRRVPALLPKD